MKVRTGVMNPNNAMWIHDDIAYGIDLDYEMHVKICERCSNEDYCDVVEYWESYDPTILINFVECSVNDPDAFVWKVVNTPDDWNEIEQVAFKPDDSAEYSAIYNGNYNTLQIVKSQWIMQCRPCSPNYPDQGDVDSPGTGRLAHDGNIIGEQIACNANKLTVLAYALPPDMYDREYDDNDVINAILSIDRLPDIVAAHDDPFVTFFDVSKLDPKQE